MRQRVAGGVVVALGAAVGIEGTTFDVRFLADPVGPKAVPFVVAVMLVAAGIHQTLRPGPTRGWPPRRVVGKLGAATAAFLAYPLALGLLGFWLSTTLVVAALSLLYGAPPRRGVAAAGLLAGALWLLFVELLALPLPIGSLWMR